MSSVFHFVVMGTLFFGVLGLIHYYLWRRLVRQPEWTRVAERGLTVLVVFLGLSLPLAMLVSQTIPFEMARHITVVPFAWLGAMMLLFVALLATDVGVLLWRVGHQLVKREAPPADPTRRVALARMVAGGVTLVGGVASGAGVAAARRPPTLIRQTIGLARLPKGFDGLRIVQISDLHIGISVGRDWLMALVGKINKLKPDMVVITGDLADGLPRDLGIHVAPLARLKSRFGTFFVTGNHEYYSDATAWCDHLTGMGIEVLRNRAVPLFMGTEKLFVAGVNDETGGSFEPAGGPDFDRALDGVAPAAPVVLLAHQPKAVFEAAKAGVDLVLSGHTHGGQIWPFSMLVGLQQPYNRGFAQHSTQTAIYVNQGTYLWGPQMRLGTVCEITEITLRAGNSSKRRS